MKAGAIIRLNLPGDMPVLRDQPVFIHPFGNGNGRMARLWKTALLMQRNPIFRYLPIENRIHEYRQEYDDAIAACHSSANCIWFPPRKDH